MRLGTPGFHFRVNGIAKREVELSGISSLEHHGEVFAVDPIGLGTDLLAHPDMKRGARKRIGNRDSDIVRPRCAHQFNGFLDVKPGFARIPKLKKETSSNARMAQML